MRTDSAGLAPDAEVRLSAEPLDWATLIFVMEKVRRSELQRQYRRALAGKRVICLGIPDDYVFCRRNCWPCCKAGQGAACADKWRVPSTRRIH